MGLGLLGKKIGMTKFYDLKGNFFPVTLINIFNNYIVQIKNNNIFQVVFALKNIFNLNNPLFFHYLKNNVYFYGVLKEFKVSLFDFYKFTNGDILPLNIFYINQKINILSRSIGKGFSGVIKRFNFKSGDSSHGNSKSHNKPGSIGMSQDPGRVFLGKKLPGHLGNKNIYIKNLKILKIDFDHNVYFIKGCVAGSENSTVFIFPV